MRTQSRLAAWLSVLIPVAASPSSEKGTYGSSARPGRQRPGAEGVALEQRVAHVRQQDVADAVHVAEQCVSASRGPHAFVRGPGVLL